MTDAERTLAEVEARMRSASRGRRGGRGGIVQAPDLMVLALLLDAGPAGMANVALCERTGRSEAFMAIMLKHAAEVGITEWSVPRDQRAAYRLTDLGREWVLAKQAVEQAGAAPELEPATEAVEGEAVEIRELPPG